MPAVEFRKVDIIFGDQPEKALPLAEAGKTREEILEETGNILGVTDCSLAVDEGEICVLMGLSGSGKSTLLRAVNGLNKVTRGAVLVGDSAEAVDVANCDADTLRQLRMSRIAMVFQQFGLLPWRTVAENVGLGLELRGMGKTERAEIVAEKLQLVALEEWSDKYAHELSGGMQQRVGLARAFATDADILLMDEPFSALDPLIRAHLQDELLALQTRLKKTIIFVSHDLDEALKIGSHIAIMEGGRIVQIGEPEQIVLHPASQYVADFVAHMNPLNVLRGSSLMTPVEALRRSDGELLLDSAGHCRLSLDKQGRASKVTVEGEVAALVSYETDADSNNVGKKVVTMATPEIRMRQTIEIRHRTGTPVLFVESGKVVGVVGDDEIYRGMLRQTSLAEKNDASPAPPSPTL